MLGMALVTLSLPVLFLVHGALKLGKPPVFGLVVLALTVIVSMAIAGAIGAGVGKTSGNWIIAAVLGLVLGVLACGVVAPLYGGLILDHLTRQATGAVAGTVLGQDPQEFARNKAIGAGKEAFNATREGRLRAELARLQDQAKQAVSAQGRAQSLDKAKAVAAELAATGTDKGVALLKSGVAQLSAFTLLVWALIGPPLGAAWECRRFKG